MADEKALRRIRAMLDMAERASTPEGERQQALETAMRLMSLYGIEQAHLVGAGEVRDEIGSSVINLTDPHSHGKFLLVHYLAKALRCKAIATKYGGSRYQEVTVVGAESDRARVEMLYTSLLVQAYQRLSFISGPSAGRTRVLRASFLRGFAFRIGERLTEIEVRTITEDTTSTGSGAEIVLVDRVAQVDRMFAEMFPSERKIKSRRSHNDAAWNAGKTQANRADLGQVRVGHGSRELTA
jgi:hypothetical protein